MATQQKTLTLTSSSSNSNSIKFLYSYGGKILPRPSDSRLRYIGGLTRVISVPRSISFTELMEKLENLCGYSVTLRCQLPNEDLDVLISIKSNDDLLNVIEEYDNASLNSGGKELKIRAILSPKSSTSSSSSSLSASPASSSSSLSSMSASADVSPTDSDHHHHHRRFVNQKPPMMAASRLSSSPVKSAQYGVVRPVPDYYYYYPCHVQANFRPSYLQYSNRLH